MPGRPPADHATSDNDYPRYGDIVIYPADPKAAHTHVGIVCRTHGAEVTLIRSKWTQSAVYDSGPDNTGFGNSWSVWRRGQHNFFCGNQACNELNPSPVGVSCSSSGICEPNSDKRVTSLDDAVYYETTAESANRVYACAPYSSILSVLVGGPSLTNCLPSAPGLTTDVVTCDELKNQPSCSGQEPVAYKDVKDTPDNLWQFDCRGFVFAWFDATNPKQAIPLFSYSPFIDYTDPIAKIIAQNHYGQIMAIAP